MNEAYNTELQQEINFLYEEINYLQKSIEAARKCGDTDEYTRLMRVCLPVQKQYLKLCAEQEKREQAESEIDPLAEFNTPA